MPAGLEILSALLADSEGLRGSGAVDHLRLPQSPLN